jgi:hypothetical protein
MQSDRQRDPVAASGFEDHEGRLGGNSCGGEPLLKGGEAGVGLLERAGLWSGSGVSGPGGGEALGGDIDANIQLVAR